MIVLAQDATVKILVSDDCVLARALEFSVTKVANAEPLESHAKTK